MSLRKAAASGWQHGWSDVYVDGSYTYGVVAIEDITCKNGSKRAVYHVGSFTEPGAMWPDQIKEPLTERVKKLWSFDAASKCKGTSDISVRMSNNPLSADARHADAARGARRKFSEAKTFVVAEGTSGTKIALDAEKIQAWIALALAGILCGGRSMWMWWPAVCAGCERVGRERPHAPFPCDAPGGFECRSGGRRWGLIGTSDSGSRCQGARTATWWPCWDIFAGAGGDGCGSRFAVVPAPSTRAASGGVAQRVHLGRSCLPGQRHSAPQCRAAGRRQAGLGRVRVART